MIDGRRMPIGNFRIEPPGLFQGRGEHPKMGMLKKRVTAEQVIINVGERDEVAASTACWYLLAKKVPKPPEGHRWKEIRHDNSVYPS